MPTPMTMSELKGEIDDLNNHIWRFLQKTGYVRDDMIDMVYDEADPDERFIVRHYNYFCDRLMSAGHLINYVEGPVTREGYLHQQENGRYWMGNYEFTSGNSIEVFVDGDWIATRIEYADRHGGYYAFACPDVPLEGCRARVRRSRERWY